MKKTLILLLLFAVSLIQIAPAAAWSTTTHHEIADETYYALPVNVQEKLSLEAMQDGSDDPDIKFFDFKNHHYPESYDKATYWLDKGKESYNAGNYSYASYCFGVASHYISDSFSAPHCEVGCSSIAHALYETRAMFLTPQITYSNGDIESIMVEGNLEGKADWEGWLGNEDDSYIQSDLNDAVSASYVAIKSSVS
ncbi:MAG TPA: zinc dependent phospholipase C family protein [Methanobacterium sp.]